MSKFMTAIYEDRRTAEVAVDRLVQAGFSRDDISVLMSDGTRGRDFSMEQSTKAPEGAASGGAIGGTLGAIAAGLAAVGTIATGGAGIVAAGPIVAALAGGGAGAAAGGIIGGLVGLGVPEHEAKVNAERLEKGDILVGVQCDKDRTDAVETVFGKTGGADIKKG